jgi:hypothetical protein
VGPDLPAPPGRLAISASPPPGLPIRVMAHLLGTVVAYEALHVHLNLQVYLLVTVSLPERKRPLVSSPGYREGCMT